MRSLILCLTLALAAPGVSYATDSSIMDVVPTAQRLSEAPPGASIVYFLRPEDGTGTIRAILLDDEYFVGQLVEDTHIAYVTKPGKHLFNVLSTTMEFWEKVLEPGKTYFVTVRRSTPRHPFVFIEHATPEDIAAAEKRVGRTHELRVNERGRSWIEGRRTNIRWMRSKYFGEWQASQEQASQAQTSRKPASQSQASQETKKPSHE